MIASCGEGQHINDKFAILAASLSAGRTRLTLPSGRVEDLVLYIPWGFDTGPYSSDCHN